MKEIDFEEAGFFSGESAFLTRKARNYRTAKEFHEKVVKPLKHWKDTVITPLKREAAGRGVGFSINPIILEGYLNKVLWGTYTSRQLECMSVRGKAIKVLGKNWTDRYVEGVLDKCCSFQLLDDPIS